jgi:hypothetical protein
MSLQSRFDQSKSISRPHFELSVSTFKGLELFYGYCQPRRGWGERILTRLSAWASGRLSVYLSV